MPDQITAEKTKTLVEWLEGSAGFPGQVGQKLSELFGDGLGSMVIDAWFRVLGEKLEEAASTIRYWQARAVPEGWEPIALRHSGGIEVSEDGGWYRDCPYSTEPPTMIEADDWREAIRAAETAAEEATDATQT